MSTLAWVTMVVIAGFVWGGFVLLLVYALRREGARRRAGPGDSDTAGP